MDGLSDRTVSVCIDVETDWGGRGDTCEGIERGLPAILGLLADHGAKATLFVSGGVLPQCAARIREAADAGHEIASHGASHPRRYDTLPPDRVRQDVRASARALEDAVGARVAGFRAPRFRPPPGLPAVLRECGMEYDSSVSTSWLHARPQGVPASAEPFPWDGMLEVPVSSFSRLRLPLGLLWVDAARWPRAGVAGLPAHAVMYMHPFDVLDDKPAASVGLGVRAWHACRGRRPGRTLDRLLRGWSEAGRAFLTLRDLAAQATPPSTCT